MSIDAGSHLGPILRKEYTAGRVRLVVAQTPWWIAAAAFTVAMLTLAYVRVGRPEKPLLRMSIAPPPDVTLHLEYDACGSLTISPDGHYVTFLASGEDGTQRLWLRPLDGEAAPIIGTENAAYPFWSPDSQFIAFFASGKLKKVDLGGSPPVTICDAPQSPRSGAWNKDGTILFSPSSTGDIYQVSADGGVPARVTKRIPGEATHRWASFLPDGKHFLYLAGRNDTSAIYVDSIEKPGRKLLVRARSNAVYAEGYLLYARDRTLLAQPFDPKRLTLEGNPIPLAHDVEDSYVSRSVFAVSDEGTLVYEGGAHDTRMVVGAYDRAGQQTQQIGDAAEYRDVAISPDGLRLAVTIFDKASGVSNIWIHDLQWNFQTRLTFAATDRSRPVWSPDGSRIAYAGRNADGTQDIYIKNARESGSEQLLYHDAAVKEPTGFSPDGKLLLFNSIKDPASDVWQIPLAPGASASPLLATGADERDAHFSPDGKWIAYRSNDTGAAEAYIAQYPSLAGKGQVSKNGGYGPNWRADGHEIVYVTEDGKAMAVPVTISGSTATLGAPALLSATIFPAAYAIKPDHNGFYLVTPKSPARTINVVTNWPVTIKK